MQQSPPNSETIAIVEQLESHVAMVGASFLQPLLDQICCVLGKTLFAVHEQKLDSADATVMGSEWGESARGDAVPCSKYMRKFVKTAGMAAKLLGRYDAKNPTVRRQAADLVQRLVTYATRHIALVGTYRHLPETHLQALHADMAQFTLAMGQFPAPLKLPELKRKSLSAAISLSLRVCMRARVCPVCPVCPVSQVSCRCKRAAVHTISLLRRYHHHRLPASLPHCLAAYLPTCLPQPQSSH